jgi:hypothetical protein
MRVQEARRALLSRADLEAHGVSTRDIKRLIGEGGLRRVDHGWYVRTETWNAEFTEGKHLLRIVAAECRRRGSADVVSHHSAAVLHGLPLIRHAAERVHLSGSFANGRVRASEPMVARHELAVSAVDRVEIDGIECTSLARTAADVVRSSAQETGIAMLDAALRKVAWEESSHTYDLETAEAFRREVARQLPQGGRGVKQGRRLVGLADGRAQLPGESVSRLYLIELGFDVPRLQVPVDGPDGRTFYVDFGLDDVGAWGEFDGRSKYLDPRFRGHRGIEEIVLQEKLREDWIRGTTNRRFVRWGSDDIRTALSLGKRLARFGLHAG